MRCCYRSSLLAVAAACVLSASSLSVAADRVLVVGAQKDLVNDVTTGPSAFSPAGLTLLLADALLHDTDSVVDLPAGAVQSPAVLNPFKRLHAYASIYVDRADAAVLDSVDAASTSGYHKVFDLTTDSAFGSATEIPAAVAGALKQSAGVELLCAGSSAVCQSDVLRAVVVDESKTTLDNALDTYTFLKRGQDADEKLALELVRAQTLIDSIRSTAKPVTAFIAVQYSSVAGVDKPSEAREAVAKQIQELLSALQSAYPTSSGAQVVATGPAPMGGATALSRMLLSFTDPVGSSLDDDDSDDDVPVNGTVSDVTMSDIAEYQIVLWTSVMLGAVLILVIIAMCNMAPKRDSLLYAKFTTSNGSRKFD